MSIILRNRKYLFSIMELIGGIVDRWIGFKKPCIQLTSSGGAFWSFEINICGKKEKFYVKKGALKKSELQAVYTESFYNYILNGHSYMRPEMKIKHGDVVIDAGACEGFYSRYALNMGASKVIIFEPCPELAEGLKKTFEEEILIGKVIIVEKALGRREYKDILYVDQNMFCSSSITEGSEDMLKKEVSVIALDTALRNIGVNHVDILKMDIEGAELDAVIGAKRTIKRCHPKLIIATYHSYHNATRVKNICRRIDHKYKCRTFGCYQFEKPFRPFMTLLC